MRALVIAVHGFHAGYLGCYGNDWIDTPTFDRLAARGVVFDQHYADRPDAAGAWRAWRTGRYHLPCGDLFQVLHSQGVRLTLVADERAVVPDDLGPEWQRVAAPDNASISPALAALDRASSLVWLQTSALLPPWPPAEQETESEEIGEVVLLQSGYARAVGALDASLAHLLDRLEQRGRYDDVLLVLTSDGGFALGEHGGTGFDLPSLHEERIHLPLIVRLPGAAEAGRRVFALTQAVDLLPTLFDFFSVPIPAAVHGHSLRPLLLGEADAVRPYAYAGIPAGESIEYALRTPTWGFLLRDPSPPGTGPRLYVKPDDRWEVNNVLQHHLELVEHFEQVLRGFIQATREPAPLQAPVLRDVEAAHAATAPSPSRPAARGGDLAAT